MTQQLSAHVSMNRSGGRSVLTRPVVLLVDGDCDTRDLYAAALPAYGFATVTACDAGQALARALAVQPDVIVTEVSLPGAEGWALVDSIRRSTASRDIPVIILTAQPESLVRRQAQREHCAKLLIKPCLPKELARVIGELKLGHPRAGSSI